MSRLTASPLHRPPPFNYPQLSSPPETDSEYMAPASVTVAGRHTHHEPAQALESESPSARFRKVSTLAYHASGLREARERDRRSFKSFVVVMPPTSLQQHHGQLGHTLSQGPPDRLSQGLLMPLFPTMYGQLTAIAKEFNFPSTAGICLYLQYTDNGITVSPRIADDTWQFMWGHVFESTAPPTSRGPPICGKIEFDIDIRFARWYSAWIGSASAHSSFHDIPASIAPSVAHYREESRTVTEDDRTEEPARRSRHVPRKLSLVDKIDTTSLRSFISRPHSRANVSPPDAASEQTARVLSPVAQVEEPPTARLNDLEKRVKSWRASAKLSPTAFAATGQVSLEPANMPNTIPLETAEVNDEELRLEEYQWSISSAGPGDYDILDSPVSWARLPSVHLANRMEESVCLTPSVCTSFGPSDYTLPSAVLRELNIDPGRIASPDIAFRMLEDAPLTPSTATSWGPASVAYSIGLSENDYCPSVDLGARGFFSRPCTPSTATSWGPPEEYPPSPMTPFRVHTPDLGQRAFDEDGARPLRVFSTPYDDSDVEIEIDIEESVASPTHAPWGMVWPHLENQGDAMSAAITPALRSVDDAAPWSHNWPHGNLESAAPSPVPWNHSWPHQPHAEATPAPSPVPWNHAWPHQPQHDDTPAPSPVPWNHSWPQQPQHDDTPAASPAPWNHSWPHHSHNRLSIVAPTPRRAMTTNDLPSARPWQNSWPHFDARDSRRESVWAHGWPAFATTPLVPAFSQANTVSSDLSQYPYLNIYPAVYPHFDLYPSVAVAGAPSAEAPVSRSGYPHFILYSAQYPAFDLYPSIAGAVRATPVASRALLAHYPHFDLYPSRGQAITSRASRTRQYPDFNLYPVVQKTTEVKSHSIVLRLQAAYPSFNLYPSGYPGNLGEIYPAVRLPTVKVLRESPHSTSSQYPDFCLYPPAAVARPATLYSQYPDFCIYPPSKQTSAPKPIAVQLGVGYPTFNLYPAVYPHFDLYPAARLHGPAPAPALRSSAGYPDFALYPSVSSRAPLPLRKAPHRNSGYPFFDLYPAPGASPTFHRSAGYPNFDLYPSVGLKRTVKQHRGYPFFDLYHPVNLKQTLNQQHGYPFFNLYPAPKLAPKRRMYHSGYPTFDLYPLGTYTKVVVKKRTSTSVIYPRFCLYPAVYPHFDLYGPVTCGVTEPTGPTPSQSSYPFFDLYPAVYPAFNLYPAHIRIVTTGSGSGRKTHQQLHDTVVDLRNRKRTVKSHKELHESIFMNNLPTLIMPSSSRVAATSRKVDIQENEEPVDSSPIFMAVTTDSLPSPQRRQATRARSSTILRATPPMPPPRIGLPQHPGQYRMSRVPDVPVDGFEDDFDALTSGSTITPTSSSRTMPASLATPPSSASAMLKRSTSLSSTSPSPRRVASPGSSRLPPVTERPALARMSSLAQPSRPEPEEESPRALSAGHRKRDSLVLQRVRAFDHTKPEPMSALPVPPLRSAGAPRALDRSRYSTYS